MRFEVLRQAKSRHVAFVYLREAFVEVEIFPSDHERTVNLLVSLRWRVVAAAPELVYFNLRERSPSASIHNQVQTRKDFFVCVCVSGIKCVSGITCVLVGAQPFPPGFQ